MIDIDALKRDKRPQSSTIVHALIDRLEAAESEALEEARLNGMGSEREAALMAKLEAAEKERDALRAKIEQIEQMERQEPVGWLLDGEFYEVRQMSLYKDNEPLQGQTALYALPGAQTQGEEK